MLPFKDISYAQGAYNMGANPDQIIAIRMSSGEGGLHFDSDATANYNNASAAGKVIINYHFAGTADPTTEAKFFIEAVSPLAEGDIYALDIELGQDAAWINTFVEYVHSVTNCWPLVYMNISTANAIWSGVNSNCGLWLAAPSWGFDQVITELNSSIVYVAQQGPTVNGVDTDMFFAPDLAHVKAYGYKNTPVPTPAPAPAPVAPPTPTTTDNQILPSPTPPAAPAPTPAPVTPPTPAGQGSVKPTPVPTPVKSVEATTKLSFWQKLLALLHIKI